jgi:hypothetical protein
VSSSFLIQSGSSYVVIGCGAGIPAKLESLGLTASQVQMWVPLGMGIDQVLGLFEVGASGAKPYLAAPAPLITQIRLGYEHMTERKLSEDFQLKPTLRITIQEEHITESLLFIYHSQGYSLSVREAGIFISGALVPDEAFLHEWGVPAQIILHSCEAGSLSTMPLYLQKKIWLYGYPDHFKDLEHPLPMLYLPQGAWIYDSDRKDKLLDKERFIRESSRRQLGASGVAVG